VFLPLNYKNLSVSPVSGLVLWLNNVSNQFPDKTSVFLCLKNQLNEFTRKFYSVG
jgi:hypothetical protein